MATDTTFDVAESAAADAPGRIAPLSELDDFEVADGFPEIRGWDVADGSGRSIGYVYDLLADLDAMRVRYLDVELDPEFAGSDPDRRVLIPIERAGLDGGAEAILLEGIDAAEVRTLVPWARRGVTVAREADVALTQPAVVPPADVPLHIPATTPAPLADAERSRGRQYDDARLFGADRPISLSDFVPPVRGDEAEKPEVSREASREVKLGDITVRRSGEFALPHDQAIQLATSAGLAGELEIERRPLRAGEDVRASAPSDDEIRIPIMSEELIVEKRLVAKEVLIIRKRRATEQRAAEADLRRERVGRDDPAAHLRGPGTSTRADDTQQTRLD